MLGSLRARLIISFALVVGLAVFLAGAGALFLMRDEQQQTARERYGRLPEPLNNTVADAVRDRRSLSDIEADLTRRAQEANIRIILLDQDEAVVFDSAGKLVGRSILVFENNKVAAGKIDGFQYRWVDYNRYGEELTLFGGPPLAREDDPSFATPVYQAVIAIPRSELASAWLDLVPRLALAGAISLTVSFLVSFVISRSISGPLARITQASKQMARGNYDVHIPIRGQDEVGRLAEAFNQMAREVSTSQRMMKDLLGNVSHELKTPLTSIHGFSQAIVDGVVTDPDDIREYSQTIHNEAERMRDLVEDLMLLSQIESGQMRMQPKKVDLRQLLEGTLERFQWSIRDAGIRTGIHVERVPDVWADERRLEQVFSNLLQNAVRHTPPGGMITITGKTLKDGAVSIGVHNTGSVIPEEDLPRVFERFFQVDRARTRKGGSSGLGLSIVKEIVEAHGGTVRAISSEEFGTEFLVILPSQRASGIRQPRPHGPTPDTARNGTAAGPRKTPAAPPA